MDELNFYSDVAIQWDAMRERLRQLPCARRSLSEIAKRVGLGWGNPGGDTLMNDLFVLRWLEIRSVLGRGTRKHQHLMRITHRLFIAEFGSKTSKASWATDAEDKALPEKELSDAWEQARQILAGTAFAEMTISDCAKMTGWLWPYFRGNERFGVLLAKNWEELRKQRGLGRHKTAELLEIARTAARSDLARLKGVEAPAAKEIAGMSLTDGLAGMGIEPGAPTELLFLSCRAMGLLRREKIRTVGALLDLLLHTEPGHLRQNKGIGRLTVSELYKFMSAVTSGQVDLIRRFLPLRSSGRGLCFSSFAKHLLAEESRDNREVLFAYLVQKGTLRAAGERIGITRERVRQIASSFIRSLERGLICFPEEKTNLWDAWHDWDSFDLVLEDDIQGEDKLIISGALVRIFSRYPKGKAILAHRESIFDEWWNILCDFPEFYFSGLCVAKFVRDRNEPYLLHSFLDYLEGKTGVDVNKTTGKAVYHDYPLRRIVRAMVMSSSAPVNPTTLLKRLKRRGLCADMNLFGFASKLRYWVARRYIPVLMIDFYHRKSCPKD